MSLFLSVLGSTALLGTAMAAPSMATMPNSQQQSWVNDGTNEVGIYQINKKIEVNAIAEKNNKHAEQTILEKFEINWADLGISVEDYQRIDWENSSFVLVSDIYYKNNILGNSGTTVPKRDYFLDINPGFNLDVKYLDNGKVSNSTSSVENSWEYSFSDNGEALTFDVKLSASASTTKSLVSSYASFNFVNLAYAIIFN